MKKIMDLLQREKISIPYGVVTEVIMDMMSLPLLHIKIQTEKLYWLTDNFMHTQVQIFLKMQAHIP